MSGWVKLHRKIAENTLFRKNAAARHVFMDLLHMAAWSDCKQDWNGKPVDVARGQVMISTRELADYCGMTHQKIRTIVSVLMNHQIVKINTDGTSRPSIITVCNYCEYQDHQHRHNTEDNTALTQTQHTKEEEEEVKEERTTVVGRRAPLFKQMDLPTDLDPELEQMRQAWNAYARDTGKPQVRKLTKDRRDRIKQVMADNGYTIDDFNEAMEMANKSDYLVEIAWFSFDWIWKEDSNLSKVCEGRYGNGRHAQDDFMHGMTPKEYQQYLLSGGQ